MKHLQLLGISAMCLALLAACNQNTESSVGDSASAVTTTPAASAPVAATQALSSKDGKISVATSGQFSDKLSEAGQLISDIPTEQLLLLQRDEAADVLLYAADLGKAKADAPSYLKNLSDAIKADSSLKNVEVAAPQGTQLAYQFSETAADGDVNQACQTVHQDHIYSVCAISNSQSPAQLAQVVANIAVK